MRNPLPTLGLLALALASVAVPTGDAFAQEERRVLKARQVTDVNLSEEYLAKAREKRLESIQFLKELIAEQGSELTGTRKAEMMLRLADLYFQQGRDEFLSEMAAFDKEYDKCFNVEGCELDALEPNNDKSKKWQNRSIKLYKNILTNYPRYQRSDEATFYMAQALSDTGKRDEGKDYWESLVRMYPDSQFVPDTYVNLGEYYFDKDNAYKALTNYKKATAYRDHDKYGFSLYKLAWCYYNVGEYGKSISSMKQVVSYSMADATGSSSKLQLQDEALKDLVRFFADAGELDEAYEYFNKLGKKDLIRSMLKQLATKYFENGKFEESVQTYRRLIAENPTSADNPDYQHEIIQAYQKMGLKNETFTEIDRMLKTYGKDTAWARANASNQQAIADAGDKVEKNLRQVALYHHNRAKKIKKGTEAKESYAMAYKGYKVYLREFPGNDHVYEIHYSFAELLYTIKKFDEAFDQYMAVVKLDPEGKHSKFCAESAIFSADEMVKKESAGTTIAKAKPGEANEPLDLTDWEKRLIESSAQYADLYPGDKKVKNIIYKTGYLLYNKYRFGEAADQFNKVIKMEPGSKEAEQAANLILDSFVVNEDWNNLQKNSKFYYEQEGLGSSTFKKEVYGVYQKASLKIIEVNFENEKNYKNTADAYLTFYDEFPKSDENSRILNNASIYYHKIDDIESAMEVRHILIDDPKFGEKTKYYYDQLGGLGFDYETVADFDKAATYYEKIFKIQQDSKKFAKWKKEGDDLAAQKQGAADAIYSAAVFRKALGDAAPAISNYKSFISTYPDDDRVNDVKLTIGKIYEDDEQWSQAANVYYGFYTKADDTTPIEFVYFARLHYARALEKQNQSSKATRVYQDTVKLYGKYIEGGGEPGAHTEFVAEMMFKLAQPTFDKYEAMVIGGVRPGSSRKSEDKQLGESLKKKAQSLVETEKVYTELIKTGAGEWGLAGLIMLGRVYENMGESLSTSHIPTYLTEDQIEIYTMALEDQVYPQVEKSVAAYSAALSKSYELTLYNDNTAFATRRLGELRPDDFPGLAEELPEVRETSAQSRTFDFETTY